MLLAKDTYLVNDEVQITCRHDLSIQQVPLALHPTHTPTRLLHDHQLLHHLLLVGVEEVGELRRVERGIQLQEAAQGGNGRLGTDVGEEEGKVALSGFDWWVLDVALEELRVLVRWRVGGDEFRASV